MGGGDGWKDGCGVSFVRLGGALVLGNYGN
jgi:hypothetical protein